MTGPEHLSDGATPDTAPRRIDLAVDLAWVAIAAVALIVSSRLQFSTSFGPGPGLMPTALSAILLLLGILRLVPVAVDAVRHRRFRFAPLSEASDRVVNTLRFIGLAGALFLYAMGLEVFGFTLMCGALTLVALLIFGARPVPAIAFAVIGALALRIGFGTLLDVQLPAAHLAPLAAIGL